MNFFHHAHEFVFADYTSNQSWDGEKWIIHENSSYDGGKTWEMEDQ